LVIIKTSEEIEGIRKSSRIVAEVLEVLKGFVRPGLTTWALNRKAEEVIRKRHARPAFKGYKPSFNSEPYPAAICASINEEVVHGLPSKRRVLREGDIVSVDVGVVLNGFFGDGAYTYAVGEISDGARRLMEVTEQSLYRGIEQAVPGNRVGDISCAVQQHVESHGYSVVKEYVGHGVGKQIHEDPPIPNYGACGQGPKLVEGMTIAIEPMVAQGRGDVLVRSDGWTAYTKDGSLAAHFEHTIAITKNGPEILTVV
jgi:methionyl aminopeptidase